jgi:hypothetical protein
MNTDIMFALIKELSPKDNEDKISVNRADAIEARRMKKFFFLDDQKVLFFQRNLNDKPRRVIIGKLEMKKILREFHDEPLGGHLGVDNTISKIKKIYYWPKMSEDIENYVRSCIICQKRKTKREDIKLTPITREPVIFKHIGIDIMGPLPQTIRGKRYIVLAVDLFSKWVEAKPIKDADAQTISEFVYEDIICRHGIPMRMTSDRGTEFVNDLITILAEKYKIKHITTTAYHPQGNGQTERSNQTVKNILSKITRKGDWDIYLPSALFVTRTMPNESTKFTPSELIYGHQMRQVVDKHIADHEDESDSDIFVDHYLEEKKRIGSIRQKAQTFIEKAQTRQKKAHDKAIKTDAIKLHIGDKVLVYRNMIEQNWSAKLEPRWDGPYRVQDIKGTTFFLKNEDGTILPRTFNRTRLKKFTERTR